MVAIFSANFNALHLSLDDTALGTPVKGTALQSLFLLQLKVTLFANVYKKQMF
jgi:hypothetical protein